LIAPAAAYPRCSPTLLSLLYAPEIDLRPTVMMTVSLLIKARIRITTFSALGLVLLLLQILACGYGD
jgi:hypothetical protein